ncbi:alpha/beta hydrolase [Arachnia propionica]|uniref:Alpha/beta hydrolase n=1 Tax=Arachnia propionica TaxID=1750 RepID=A0A3P1WWC9_9ACTN|nr:alpha/beta hydrolase [Arachnia propionica]RRD48683.1 alpha/beta hydrolase [Arachnia propionica]
MTMACAPDSRTPRRLGVCLAAAALVLGLGVSLPGTRAVAQDPPPDVTSTIEQQRVDSVPTPELAWAECPGRPGMECTTVKLPLDYDEPEGTQIDVAVLKHPARKPDERIGSLFVNPGGPGGSGKDFAVVLATQLSPEIVDRFDLIGMDPRGIGDSTPLNCFADPNAAMDALREADEMGFPTTRKEARTFQKSLRTIGEACASNASELSSAMSTAQVARDMEVLRRAVGDDKLSYLGVSYGSYLGQVYANMFPDRVRAVVIDGVMNPTEWLGTFHTASQSFGFRNGSALGAEHALNTLLDRCAASEECHLADPRGTLDRTLERLRTEPVSFPLRDGSEITITYQRFTAVMASFLYSDDGFDDVIEYIVILDQLASPEDVPAQEQIKLGQAFLALEERAEDELEEAAETAWSKYDEWVGLKQRSRLLTVICSEGSHTTERGMRRQHDAIAKALPYFGLFWHWSMAACASPTWKSRDEDSYRGPFNRRTAAPVLVVGNEFDPATHVGNAQEVAHMLPSSRLVISNNWGHIAYRSSACTREVVDDYLLEPKDGQTVLCRDGRQPFSEED